MPNPHFIDPQQAKTLSGLFAQRVQRDPERIAYYHYDNLTQKWLGNSWKTIADKVVYWQCYMQRLGINTGDGVALMLPNSQEWIICEQAALGLGAYIVPIYTNDRAENIAYILNDAQVKLLIFQDQTQWLEINKITDQLPQLDAAISLDILPHRWHKLHAAHNMIVSNTHATPLQNVVTDPHHLATVVYTSGTTGRAKGVMLSHWNILSNAADALYNVPCQQHYRFLSFLPLSHMFERTVGYYIPMLVGAKVAYARSINDLAEDIRTFKPTTLVCVPRIFERIYHKITEQLHQKPKIVQKLFTYTLQIGWQRFLYQQHQASWSIHFLLWPLLDYIVARKIVNKLGGKLQIAVSGGAPLAKEISRFFISLNVPIIQGYGLTETSPILSTNTLEHNDPESVGQLLPGVKVAFSPEQELLVKSPGVMQGYWNNHQATKKVIDENGWFHTGDKAKIVNKHLYIIGRVKDIIVLSNGEKIPPTEMEIAISHDQDFDQVLVYGEGRPFLSALVVLNPHRWPEIMKQVHLKNIQQAEILTHPTLLRFTLEKINQCLKQFPGYAKIYKVDLLLEPWTVENGLLTPTLKLRRHQIIEKYYDDIERLYAGH